MTTLAAGSRWSIGRLFFVSSRIGWSWRLRQDNFQLRDGGSLDSATDFAISLLQHEGFVISGNVGISFF